MLSIFHVLEQKRFRTENWSAHNNSLYISHLDYNLIQLQCSFQVQGASFSSPPFGYQSSPSHLHPTFKETPWRLQLSTNQRIMTQESAVVNFIEIWDLRSDQIRSRATFGYWRVLIMDPCFRPFIQWCCRSGRAQVRRRNIPSQDELKPTFCPSLHERTWPLGRSSQNLKITYSMDKKELKAKVFYAYCIKPFSTFPSVPNSASWTNAGGC